MFVVIVVVVAVAVDVIVIIVVTVRARPRVVIVAIAVVAINVTIVVVVVVVVVTAVVVFVAVSMTKQAWKNIFSPLFSSKQPLCLLVEGPPLFGVSCTVAAAPEKEAKKSFRKLPNVDSFMATIFAHTHSHRL